MPETRKQGCVSHVRAGGWVASDRRRPLADLMLPPERQHLPTRMVRRMFLQIEMIGRAGQIGTFGRAGQIGTTGRAGHLKENITGRARLLQREHRGQRPLPLTSAGPRPSVRLGVQHDQASDHRSAFGNPVDGRGANDAPRAKVVHTSEGTNELHARSLAGFLRIAGKSWGLLRFLAGLRSAA